MGAIVEAGKYADVRGGRAVRGGMQILVPQRTLPAQEWFWRELKEGGVLRRYLEREKGLSKRRHEAVALRMKNFQQNNRSDLELKAAIPAREYFRWRAVDPHFWEDAGNLRSYLRDNPEARSWKTRSF